MLRGVVGRYAKTRVLVLGDSHMRVFEHPFFIMKMPRVAFDIVYVPGGTAYGLGNPNSATRTRNKFDAALMRSRHDRVLVCLGEVDTAFLLWRKASKEKLEPGAVLKLSVARYCAFLKAVHAQKRLTVLSAPLPTVPDQRELQDADLDYRRAIAVPLKARIRLTLEFNRQVARFCSRNGIDYISSDEAALAGGDVVRTDWLNRKRLDHHYARGPYARHLIQRLTRGI